MHDLVRLHAAHEHVADTSVPHVCIVGKADGHCATPGVAMHKRMPVAPHKLSPQPDDGTHASTFVRMIRLLIGVESGAPHAPPSGDVPSTRMVAGRSWKVVAKQPVVFNCSAVVQPFPPCAPPTVPFPHDGIVAGAEPHVQGHTPVLGAIG